MNTEHLVHPDTPAIPQSLTSHSGNGATQPAAELKANILMVDDRPDKLLALEATLASLGQNIVQARSGKEALRKLLQQDFAVILLDVCMPGMDGFETAALIRQRLNSEHTPIIFVTSIDNTDTHISRGYSLGAVDYLLTPIVPEILRAKVSVFVELHKKSELIKRQAEQLRQIELSKHERQLAEVADRLEVETRRNRFFTLAVALLGIADTAGHWLHTNAAWLRTLGYEPDELTGRSLLDLLHPEDVAETSELLRQLKLSDDPVDFENRCRHKDGSWRIVRWSAAPFPGENMVYFFGRDVTARREAEVRVQELSRQLEQRVAALTAANHELEAFNYSIAHDLRTPLRSMSGFARALIEDETANLTSLGMEYATRIARSAKYMDTLLLDLLAYSRLAREDMTLVQVSLDDPVHELLSVLDQEIRDRHVQVEVASPLGDATAHLPTLKQILSNLVGNSLKFVATDRPPRLRIYTAHRPGFVRLWVEDNGIGIPPQYHDKIFGLFQRLHDNQAYPGTGIGLALVRKGAERMGGATGVESEPGQGSRFWVDLIAPNHSPHAT